MAASSPNIFLAGLSGEIDGLSDRQGQDQVGRTKKCRVQRICQVFLTEGLAGLAARTTFDLGECYQAERSKTKDRRCRSDCRWLERERARGATERRSAEIVTRNWLRMRRVREGSVWKQILGVSWHGPCSSGERE